MNTKRQFTPRIATMCISVTIAVLSIVSGSSTVRAQSPSAEKVLYNFAPATGQYPTGLTRDTSGNLYVATSSGGSNRACSDGCGSILKLGSPDGRASTLYTFMYSGFDKLGPGPTGLIRDSAGNLYMATSYGGRNHIYGSVFKVRPSGSAGTVYSFQGGQDGYFPEGGLTLDSEGNLYGTTRNGGGTGCSPYPGCGVIYKVTRSGGETVLYRFAGSTDGSFPTDSVILDAAGNLYGTAVQGGLLTCSFGQGLGCGTVWKLDTFGNLTVLYTFTGGTDGTFPVSGLVMDGSGNLYGTAEEGGDPSCLSGLGCGVAFKIDSAGNFSILHTFLGAPDDGTFPAATLILDPNGNLYGTTGSGGDLSCNFGCGVVFKLDASGNETILHEFSGGATDGSLPGSTPLISDDKSSLYGVTQTGGLGNVGVIFKVQMH